MLVKINLIISKKSKIKNEKIKNKKIWRPCNVRVWVLSHRIKDIPL